MDCFLLSLQLILNSLQVLELLTIFQIDFLLIFAIRKKMINFTSINLTQWLLSHFYRNPQPPLQQMLVLRIILLHPFCTQTYQTSLLSRLFIIQCLSLAQKPSCLLSDAVLIKPHPRKTFPKSQSLLIPFTQPRIFLTLRLIHSKFMPWLSLRNYINFFPEILLT